MSSLDLEIAADPGVRRLEAQWYAALESNLQARVAYRALHRTRDANLAGLEEVRERLERTAAHLSHILDEIERLKFASRGHGA